MSRERLFGAACIVSLMALVAVGLWKTSGPGAPARVLLSRRVAGVMGTDGMLAAVIGPNEHGAASEVLQEAENTLRSLEAKMSTWLERSELSRLNRAPGGEEVPLSECVRAVLLAARRAHHDTAGAFDVTIGPQIDLWRRAALTGQTPTGRELAAARAASNWQSVRLTRRGALKQAATTRFDLGGIAKGYAIDRAAELMQRQGWSGGLVNVGGDVRCFGTTPTGEPWSIDIRNPFGQETLGSLAITDVAVCTSGDYQRYFEVNGRRRSHILDPRTGQPAEAARAVTVLAADALTADVWATALSVLGRDGLAKLPDGIDALIVEGDETNHQLIMTDGLRRRFRKNGSTEAAGRVILHPPRVE